MGFILCIGFANIFVKNIFISKGRRWYLMCFLTDLLLRSNIINCSNWEFSLRQMFFLMDISQNPFELTRFYMKISNDLSPIGAPMFMYEGLIYLGRYFWPSSRSCANCCQFKWLQIIIEKHPCNKTSHSGVEM